MATPKAVRPEITPEMRAGARANPDTWLYVIDPGFDPDADVPPWGVVGAYAVNSLGEIDEHSFRPNSDYRPSPVAQRPPETTHVLEGLLERVRAGEREQRDLLPAVLATKLLIHAAGAADTTVTGFPDRYGTVMVPVCTSPERVPPTWPGWREITGRDLVALLHGHPLVINPAGPVTALIPAEELAAASHVR
jgi:hypothetical protein